MTIKNLKILTFSLFFISFFTNAQEKKLVGKWENNDKTIVYKFNENNTLFFEQNGQGVLVKSYKLDFSKTPIWLDFKIKYGAVEQNIPALLEIIDNNTIKIEQFPPYTKKHPENFSDKTYRIHLLKRK